MSGRVHGFLTIEDAHGRWWRNLRGHIWFPLGPAHGTEGDDGWRGSAGGEWCHFHPVLRSLRLKVSTTGEETLDIAYGLGPLAQHWWNLEINRPGGHQLRFPPVRFDVEVSLTHASWCFGSDPQSWERNAPFGERLRRNEIRWWRVGWYGRGDPEMVDEVTTDVNLPEGPYPVVARLQRRQRQVRVGPYRLTRRQNPWLDFYLPILRRTNWSAEIDAAPSGGLPFPGKGENSWDCGQDHLWSIHCGVPAPTEPGDREWLAAALAKVTAAVLRDRIRYGSGIHDRG